MKEHEINSLWTVLTEGSLSGSVLAEWRDRLNADLGAARPFLVPIGKHASNYPCPHPGEPGCPRRVVRHAPDDIVAVCGNVPSSCEMLTLRKAELAVYRFDGALFGMRVAEMLDLKNAGSIQQIGKHAAWLLGEYKSPDRRRLMIALCLDHTAKRLPIAVTRSLERGSPQHIPTVVFAPFPAGRTQPNHGGAIFVGSLADLFTLTKKKELILKEPPHEFFNRLGALALSGSKKPRPSGPVPAPPGTSWTEVHIRITDETHAVIRIGDLVDTYQHSHLGLSNPRSGKGSKQWELLTRFAQGTGELGLPDGESARLVRKQRERLSQALREAFGIDAAPFYRARVGVWRSYIDLSVP